MSIAIGSDISRRLNPEEALAEAGIKLLPRNLVKAHKKLALRLRRRGIWSYLWAIPWGLEKFSPIALRLPSGFWAIAIALTAVFAGLGLAWVGLPKTGLALTLVAVIFLALYWSVFLFLFDYSNEDFQRARASWRRIPIGDYRRRIPDHLLERAEKAKAVFQRHELGEANPLVEYINEDPFILVQGPGWGIFRRCYYIGAFSTGVWELDNA